MSMEKELQELVKRNKRLSDFIGMESNLNVRFNIRKGQVKQYIRRHFENNQIFKFREINKYCLENLENDTLWFSNVDNLNDLFEGKMFYSDNPSLAFGKLNENVIRFKNKMGALSYYEKLFKKIFYPSCFTEDLNSLYMWGNYADSFKGICIEYDFLELIDYVYTFNEDSETKDDLLIYPVLYKSISDLTKLDELNFSDITPALVFLYEKPTEFIFEKEWRLIVAKKDNDKVVQGFNKKFIKPKRIYLGSRIKLVEKDLVDKLLIICKQKNIEVYQMEEKFNNKNIMFKEVIL